MAAQYPSSIPTIPTITPNSMRQATSHTVDRQQLWDEVKAIAEELGRAPSKSFATVDQRIRSTSLYTTLYGPKVTTGPAEWNLPWTGDTAPPNFADLIILKGDDPYKPGMPVTFTHINEGHNIPGINNNFRLLRISIPSAGTWHATIIGHSY